MRLPAPRYLPELPGGALVELPADEPPDAAVDSPVAEVPVVLVEPPVGELPELAVDSALVEPPGIVDVAVPLALDVGCVPPEPLVVALALQWTAATRNRGESAKVIVAHGAFWLNPLPDRSVFVNELVRFHRCWEQYLARRELFPAISGPLRLCQSLKTADTRESPPQAMTRARKRLREIPRLVTCHAEDDRACVHGARRKPR